MIELVPSLFQSSAGLIGAITYTKRAFLILVRVADRSLPSYHTLHVILNSSDPIFLGIKLPKRALSGNILDCVLMMYSASYLTSDHHLSCSFTHTHTHTHTHTLCVVVLLSWQYPVCSVRLCGCSLIIIDFSKLIILHLCYLSRAKVINLFSTRLFPPLFQ